MKEFELIYEEFHISIYKFLMRLTGDQQLICEKQETLAELGAALMNMKKAYRDVIILRIYFDCSYKEIAQALRISESAAKVRYHRGIEMLREVTDI